MLEVGAGVGDLTTFFTDRGCSVITTEVREHNLDALRKRFHENKVVRIQPLDMDALEGAQVETCDIVFCYGLLYHLIRPAEALAFLAGRTRDLLLVETVVKMGDADEMVLVEEGTEMANLSMRGQGSRPTRRWMFNQLKRLMPHVYVPVHQPWHEEYTNEWKEMPGDEVVITRTTFVGSQRPIENPRLTTELRSHQERH